MGGMTATRVLKCGISPCLLLVASLAGCARAPAPAETPPAKEAGEIKQVIEVEVDELTCHYRHQSFWTEDEFSTHLADQAQFKTDFQQDFEQGLAQSDVPVSASDYNFSFDPTTQSTSTRCDIHSAIWKEDDKYRASFFWLLRPLGLDFIDDNFTESERGLSWEGSINDISTTVTVKLPIIDNIVYKAWEYPIGHCHAHAWWPAGG
jgi:hypothetical protein